MRISIVVPMYNVAAYIQECLESLTRQTLHDHMDVILVDDGCSDNTPEIAQLYAERYPDLFRLVHKRNGGLSDARNFGLTYAQGEYIAFLDSDDWADETYYEKMLQAALAADAEICLGDLEYTYADQRKNFRMKGLSDWSAATEQKRALLSPLFAWNKLYKRSLFDDPSLRFPLHLWYEDIPVTTLLLAKARRLAVMQDGVIHYRQHPGSIMSARQDTRVLQIFSILEQMREHFTKAGLAKAYEEELCYLHVEHLRLYGMFRFIRNRCEAIGYEQSNIVLNQFYPNWRTNPYLHNLSRNNRLFLKTYNPLNSLLWNFLIRQEKTYV